MEEENIGEDNGNYWRILRKRGSQKQILTQTLGGELIKIILTQSGFFSKEEIINFYVNKECNRI